MGVQQAHQVGMPGRQAGAGLALDELDGGRLVLPFRPQQLQGAQGISGTVASGVNGRHRAAAEGLEQFVAGNAKYRLHGRP